MMKSLLLTLIFMVGIISVNANDLKTTFMETSFTQVSDTEQVSTTVDIEEIVSLSVFPNPTTETLNVVSEFEINNIKVINTIGQTVKTVNGINNTEVSIDMSSFNNGIYFIVIDNSEIVKIIKK